MAAIGFTPATRPQRHPPCTPECAGLGSAQLLAVDWHAHPDLDPAGVGGDDGAAPEAPLPGKGSQRCCMLLAQVPVALQPRSGTPAVLPCAAIKNHDGPPSQQASTHLHSGFPARQATLDTDEGAARLFAGANWLLRQASRSTLALPAGLQTVVAGGLQPHAASAAEQHSLLPACRLLDTAAFPDATCCSCSASLMPAHRERPAAACCTRWSACRWAAGRCGKVVCDTGCCPAALDRTAA